jgi:hypothetical protein
MRYEVQRKNGDKVIVEADTFSPHEIGGGSGVFSLSPSAGGIHYVFSRKPEGGSWQHVAAFSDVLSIVEAAPHVADEQPADEAALVN